MTTTIPLSPPVVVGRRSGYYWFPTLMRLGDGALFISAWDDLDAYTGTPMGFYSWSEDGGRTWSDPLSTRAPFSECGMGLPDGDHLLLPYRLFPETDSSLRGDAGIVPFGKRDILSGAAAVHISGLPRPPKHEGGANGDPVTGGFSFNGQVISLSGGGYLCTLYGRFVGDTRYSLLFAESKDGRDWMIRSVLYGESVTLPGNEGPCEAALARLQDGRLICVFRTDGNFDNVYDPASKLSATPYGVVYSADEGYTWTTPAQISGATLYGTDEPMLRLPGSVQPSLATVKDGTLILSGGRPGLFLWISRDGTGQHWEAIDLLAHHNHHCAPDETILSPINTSSYTEVIVLEDTETARLCIVYDRLPLGWRPIPSGSSEQCSIWAVTIEMF